MVRNQTQNVTTIFYFQSVFLSLSRSLTLFSIQILWQNNIEDTTADSQQHNTPGHEPLSYVPSLEELIVALQNAISAVPIPPLEAGGCDANQLAYNENNICIEEEGEEVDIVGESRSFSFQRLPPLADPTPAVGGGAATVNQRSRGAYEEEDVNVEYDNLDDEQFEKLESPFIKKLNEFHLSQEGGGSAIENFQLFKTLLDIEELWKIVQKLGGYERVR
jgi:hypothetical protein